MSRIGPVFERLRGSRAALMPFLVAGDPNLASTSQAVEALIRAGADLVVPLASVRASDLVDVDRAGAKVRVRADAIQPGDLRLGDTSLPRPNARDENIDPAKARAAEDDGGARKRGTSDDDLMRAVGAGVTTL